MIRTITPLFSIIIALVVFFFYTKPMFAEIKQLQSESEQYEQAASRARELNNELMSKVQSLQSFGPENRERLDILVPQTIDEVRALVDLSERARTHNLLFGNTLVENSEETQREITQKPKSSTASALGYNDIASTDIGFSVIGTYQQFKDFMLDIERSLVTMEVTSITFNASAGELQQYEVTVRLFALPAANQ